MNTIYWTHERIDYANDLHIVMPVYYVTEYGDNYWKTSGSLRQYYRDEPTLNDMALLKIILVLVLLLNPK